MKKIIFLLLITALSHPVFSQAYMTAAGIRAGTDWGITVRQRLTKNMTMEGIIQSSLQREEVLLTALAERHYPLVFRGLNLYTGAGLHKGWISGTSDAENTGQTYRDPFGLTFIGGVELTLGRFNFSYDFKPAINITGGEKRFYTQTGISVRYVLLTNKQYKKRQREKKKQQRRERRKERGGWFPVKF